MNSSAPQAGPNAESAIYHEAIGSSGPTVVMMHGWGRSLDALRPLGELLSTSCRVILIDLPGFGRSTLPAGASNEGGGWSTVEYSERVKAFLDQADIGRCILLGHSFGGRLSVRLAAKYPERVTGVVLIGSAGLNPRRSLAHLLRVRIIKLLTKVAKMIDGSLGTRLFAHYISPRFASRDYLQSGDLRKTLVKTVNEDLSCVAIQVTSPTLLLWGEEDQETPAEIGRSYKKLIKDSELHIFPNKGHEPFADVGSHLLSRYILRFFSSRGLSAD